MTAVATNGCNELQGWGLDHMDAQVISEDVQRQNLLIKHEAHSSLYLTETHDSRKRLCADLSVKILALCGVLSVESALDFGLTS